MNRMFSLRRDDERDTPAMGQRSGEVTIRTIHSSGSRHSLSCPSPRLHIFPLGQMLVCHIES